MFLFSISDNNIAKKPVKYDFNKKIFFYAITTKRKNLLKSRGLAVTSLDKQHMFHVFPFLML